MRRSAGGLLARGLAETVAVLFSAAAARADGDEGMNITWQAAQKLARRSASKARRRALSVRHACACMQTRDHRSLRIGSN
jgi:hypothetical protein